MELRREIPLALLAEILTGIDLIKNVILATFRQTPPCSSYLSLTAVSHANCLMKSLSAEFNLNRNATKNAKHTNDVINCIFTI